MKKLYKKFRTYVNRIALKSPARNYYLAKRYEAEKNKTVIVEHFDRWTNSVRLSVFLKSGASALDIRDVDDNVVAPDDVVSCKTDVGMRTYFWLTFSDSNTVIRISYNGLPVKLRGHVAAGKLGALTLAQCHTGQYSSKAQLAKLPTEARMLRKLMTRHASMSPYAKCWVFADRTDKADDNAEHFYRFVMSQENPPKAYFILSRDSADWARLKTDGFKLIEFESDQHLRALAGARFVISSQATPPIRYPILRKNIDTLCKAAFVFLQHGIIATDCSAWINRHTYKIFVSSTPTEYADLTKPEGPYNLSARNVFLTGMPRHDKLYQQKDDFEKTLVAVMPTWRAYLAVQKAGPGSGFMASSKVTESEYYANWVDFLKSPELKQICDARGLKVALLPHPIFRTVFSDVEFGDHIYFPSPDVSYQDVILRCALCITDYSSVANDMAAISVPIMHFAFPEKEMEAGKHTSTVDVEQWRLSAMGPVLTTKEDLLREMSDQLLAKIKWPGQSDIYAARRAREFACCDGLASQRIYDLLRGFAQSEFRESDEVAAQTETGPETQS